MADTKISALPASTTPLAGTEVLPIVQGGATKQVSVANLTAGRALSATQLTLTTGNLIVASGQGVDFSATPGTGTSELLDDYEEGTWTPTQGSGLVVTGTFTSSGTYTKIGRVVTVQGLLQATSLSSGSGALLCGGLPFAVSGGGSAGSYFDGALSVGGTVDAFSSSIYSIGIVASTSAFYFNVTYFTT